MKNGSLTINLDGAVLKNGTIELQKGEQLIISGQGVCLHKIAVVGQGLTLQSIATRARLSKDKDKEKVNGLVKLTRASGIKFTDCKIEDKSSAATYALCVEEGSSATLDNCTITGISGGTGVLAVGTGSSIIANGCGVQGCKRAGVAALKGGSIVCTYSNLVAGNASGGLLMSNRPTQSSWIVRLGSSFLFSTSESSLVKDRDAGQPTSTVPQYMSNAVKSPFYVAGKNTDVSQTPFSTGNKEGAPQLLSCKVTGNKGNGSTLEGSGTKTQATGSKFYENIECGVAVLESAHVELTSCELTNNGLSGLLVQAASAKAGPVAATEAILVDVAIVKNTKHGARVAGTDASVTSTTKSGAMKNGSLTINLDGAVLKNGTIELQKGEQSSLAARGLTLQSIATRARLSKDKDKEKVNGLVKLTRASGIKFTDCKIEDKSSAATYALCVEEGSSATLDNCTITGISGGTGVLAVGTGSSIIANGCGVQGCKRAGVAALKGGSIVCTYSNLVAGNASGGLLMSNRPTQSSWIVRLGSSFLFSTSESSLVKDRDAGQPTSTVPQYMSNAVKSPFYVAGKNTDVSQTPFSTGNKEGAPQVQAHTSCQLLSCKVTGNKGNGSTLEGSGTKTQATGSKFYENIECGVAVLESAHVELTSCELTNNGLSGLLVQAASAKAGPVAATEAILVDVAIVKNTKHGARVAGTDASVTSTTKSGAMKNGSLTINLDGAVLKNGTIELQKGEQLIISGQGVCLHKIAVVGQGLTLQSIATRARLSKDKDKEKVNGLVKLTRASGIKFTDCKIEDKSSAATYALCVEEGSSATLDNCTITGISGGTGVLAVGTGSSIIANGCGVQGCKRAGVAALKGGSIVCTYSNLVAGNASGGLLMSNRPTQSSWIVRLGSSFLFSTSESSLVKDRDAGQPTSTVPQYMSNAVKSPFYVAGKNTDVSQTPFSTGNKEGAPQVQAHTSCQLLSCKVTGNKGNGSTLEGSGTKTQATGSKFYENIECGVAVLESAHVELTSCELTNNGLSGLLVQAASAKAGPVAATEAILVDVAIVKNTKHGARVAGTDASVTCESSTFSNNCKSGLLVVEGGQVRVSGSEFNCNAVSGISLKGSHTIALKCVCTGNQAEALMATTGATCHFTECTLNACNNGCITITEKAMAELVNC
eukprot:gene18216-24667_t